MLCCLLWGICPGKNCWKNKKVVSVCSCPTCQGAGSAAGLGVVLVAAASDLHDQFIVANDVVVLHLEVQHRDVHPVLGHDVPVAGPTGVVASILRLSRVGRRAVSLV